MENTKKTKLNFYDETGKKVDVREEDIIMGIDLVKNAQDDLMKETGIDPKEKRETLASYFRLWEFLITIRAGLRPRGN